MFLDSFWGETGSFNVNDATVLFRAAALLHKVDLVMLSMQKMKFTALNNPYSSLFYSHPAPRFVKEC